MLQASLDTPVVLDALLVVDSGTCKAQQGLTSGSCKQVFALAGLSNPVVGSVVMGIVQVPPLHD